MKKLTCPVCGTEFIPQIADHYVAVTDNAGSVLSRLAGSAKPETYYDAFDCPQRGCQLGNASRTMAHRRTTLKPSACCGASTCELLILSWLRSWQSTTSTPKTWLL